MPLYEYSCPNCQERFERLLAQPTEREYCPICGAWAEFRVSTQHVRGFPYIPRNHLPRELGGDFDARSPYWADANN